MSVIDEAIAAGKFPESRRRHYERLLARDPERTRRLIASLQPVPGLDALATEPRRGPIASDAGRALIPHPFGGYVVERR
jgi:hypothetical protein